MKAQGGVSRSALYVILFALFGKMKNLKDLCIWLFLQNSIERLLKHTSEKLDDNAGKNSGNNGAFSCPDNCEIKEYERQYQRDHDTQNVKCDLYISEILLALI